MGKLFLCMTEFQLFTAINAKYHLYPDVDVDIVVGNYHGEEEKIAERIRATKLFRTVCAVNSDVEEKTIHAYLRGISDGYRQVSLKVALRNTLEYVTCRIGEKIGGPKVYLKTNIKRYNDLRWGEYDAVYAYGRRPITKRVVMWLKIVNPDCKIVQIDEGADSYYQDNVGGFQSDECMLYEPKAIVFNKPVIKLPRVSREERDFIELLNFVFDVKQSEMETYENDIIFFDQGVESSMPAYLRNATRLKKIIFHNAYKRHMKEHHDYQVRSKITQEVLGLFKKRKIWIKPHPRSSSDTIKAYKKLGDNVNIMPQYHIPWEVIVLNTKLNNTLLMALASSAVLSYPALFKDVKDVKCIVLYNIFSHKANNMELYIRKLQDLYKNNLIVPQKKEDLIDIINTSCNCSAILSSCTIDEEYKED